MKKLIALSLLSAALVGVAQAQLIQSFSGGDPLSVGPGTAGFEFTVGAAPLTLRTFGIFDEFNDHVLNGPHNIGLWDSTTQTLLAAAAVTPQASTLINGFFYVNLATPLLLQAGHTYRLAAQYTDTDFDLARGNVPSANVSINSDITLKDAYLSTGTGFNFPDLNISGANEGFFGPNAGFAAVPEPVAWAMLTGVALLCFGVYRRYQTV